MTPQNQVPPVYPVAPPYSPGPYPPHPTRPRRRVPIALLVVLGLVAAVSAVAAGAGLMAVAQRTVMKDSGVVACEALARGLSPSPSTSGGSSAPGWTQERYRSVREPFARSRYDDLRTAGTHFVDVMWQVLNGGEGAALFMVGSVVSAYADLSGACGNHGVTLPPLPK